MTSDGTTLRPVHPPATYAKPVQGGVVRTPVPAPGVVVELPDRDIYLRAEALAVVLAELGWTVVSPGSQGRQPK